MNEFILFRHKSNGVVASYPAHYAEHPNFGHDLEVYIPEEYEEDKVVSESHELPVEQRGTVTATRTKAETIELLPNNSKDN